MFSAPTLRVGEPKGSPEPSRRNAVGGRRARDGLGDSTPRSLACPFRTPPPTACLRPVRGLGECMRARA